jgi:hypothetical protein
MNYTCEKDTATVYKIRIDGRSAWAVITIRQWPKGGSIDIQSDYGNYSNSWCSIGERDFREFLLDLEFSYFMGKVRGHDYLRFSLEKTIAEVKADINEQRRDGEITKEKARECWDILEESEQERDSEDIFYRRVMDADIEGAVYDGDMSAFPRALEPDPQCQGFWDVIWPVACDVWKKELEAELAVA